MRVYRDGWQSDDLPRQMIVTVGNFDGIHTGQRRVLELVTSRARETGMGSAVVTFEPHPLSVLRPEEAPPLLTTTRQKERLLAATGVDALVVVRFTPSFSRLPARRFVRDFLVGKLAAREVYVGASFVFGRDREGDLSLLQTMGDSFGFAAFGFTEVVSGGLPVSSTRIRAAVAAGDVEEAAEMLGRPYCLGGIVVRGDGRGRGLGWPTANLSVDNELLAADGVYVTRLRIPALGESLPSVTNVGTRPTVYDEHPRLVECHVLDFDSDIYGERVELEILRRLRPEQKFPSADALRLQIGKDAEAAREYFAAASCYQQRNGAGD
jgi:riboflavin kinase/FMN adenylyltransferase